MELPVSDRIEISCLAGIFRHKSTSYKFFWMLAILEHVKEGVPVMRVSDLAIRMIVNSWFPVHYYHLSFGGQDKLGDAVYAIQRRFGFPENIRGKELYLRLKELHSHNLLPEVKSLTQCVLYRFLTPWFSNELYKVRDWERHKTVAQLSAERKSLYRIDLGQGCIFLQEEWMEYLNENIAIVEGFTKWHLTAYLQRNNPNVPGLSEKLVFPASRSLGTAYQFWINYKQKHGSFPCIYSGEPILDKKDISIDHFLPWSFVAHDQLWNLVPAVKIVNSSKGNLLPADRYFSRFADLQFDAVQAAADKPRLLEDHLILFQTSKSVLLEMERETFMKEMRLRFDPMFQLARNMGFREWNGMAIADHG